MSEYKLNLELTQQSGQTSQPPWRCVNGVYQDVVLIEEKPILFKVSQDSFFYELPKNSDFTLSKKLIDDKFHQIYDLDFNLEKFYKYLNNDENLSQTKDFCDGLRLFIAKDPFECIISSICSANNSIKRWTKSISDIKEKWGSSFDFESESFKTFPTASVLESCFEDENVEFELSNSSDISQCCNNLKSCGVGYRAPYMLKTSELFTLEMDVSEIFKMNYDEAFETIIKLPGVGPKVADCILLYGFNFKEAFPSDVWIKKIVSDLYFDGKDISVSKVRDFGMEEFGKYAGYVQLYLFHYARKSGLMSQLKK